MTFRDARIVQPLGWCTFSGNGIRAGAAGLSVAGGVAVSVLDSDPFVFASSVVSASSFTNDVAAVEASAGVPPAGECELFSRFVFDAVSGSSDAARLATRTAVVVVAVAATSLSATWVSVLVILSRVCRRVLCRGSEDRTCRREPGERRSARLGPPYFSGCQAHSEA